MRPLTLLIIPVVLAACTTMYSSTSSPTVATWEGKGRDISELIAVIGPFDTTSIRGESSAYDNSWGHSTPSVPGEWRLYNWFRFGNCRLVARTSLEGKIQEITLEGTGAGCNVYLDKLGKS